MKYDFDSIVDRKTSYSVKWDMNYKGNYVGDKEDFNPLWVADMDFPCAQPIVDAIVKRAKHPIYGYTYYDADTLNAIASKWYRDRYGWEVNKEHIIFSLGVVASIKFSINAFTKPGDGIIIQPPVYAPFRRLIIKNDRRLVYNPLKMVNGAYQLDFEDLKQKASDPDVTMMILCSPHNPGGRVWNRDELSKITDICEKNDVLLLSDEIHSDLTRKGIKFTPVATVGNPENIITCTAPSKAFNIPGLFISSVIIKNDEFKERWKKEAYLKGGLSKPNPFGVAAFKAAYEEGEEWLEQVNEYIDSNLEWLWEYIKENLPTVRYEVPEGTYLAWLDIRQTGWEDDSKFAEMLFAKTGVLVEPGSIFSPGGDGFIRINAACPKSRLVDAMQKIKSVLVK